MGWSKACIVRLTITIILLLPVILFMIAEGPYLGIPVGGMIAFEVWFSYKTIHTNRYVVADNEIAVIQFWRKTKIYRIDRIMKIEYADLGYDWGRTAPNARFQLAIYFTRDYVKSVMPFRFGPADRDGFVESLLESNPSIEVDRKTGITNIYKDESLISITDVSLRVAKRKRKNNHICLK